MNRFAWFFWTSCMETTGTWILRSTKATDRQFLLPHPAYISIYMNMRQLYEQLLSRCLIMKCYEQWIVIMEEIPNTFFLAIWMSSNVQQTFRGSFVGLATPTPCSTSKWCKRHSTARGGPPTVQHGPQHLATSWQSSIAMEHPQCLQGSGWKDGGFHGKFCNTTAMALGMVSNSQAFQGEHPSNFPCKE